VEVSAGVKPGRSGNSTVDDGVEPMSTQVLGVRRKKAA
jgi:hypothetical protein